MSYIKRAAEETVARISKMFPVFFLTGSRQVGKTAIKNFRVLDPVSRQNESENFDGLGALKTEIGTGSVICMANDLLPVDQRNWYVPVWLI